MKKINALLLAMLLLVSITAACKKDTPATAESPAGTPAQVLRVGMECAYAPYNWTQFEETEYTVSIGNGEYADGYDVAIAKLVADKLGMNLEIVKTDWDGLPPSLTSGKIDLIIAGMTDTLERRETLDFTLPYWVSDVVLVVKKDGAFATATQLSNFAGAKVTGQQGTLHYDLIDKIDGVNKLEAYADFPTMLMALSSGKIDAYIAESPTAFAATISNPDVTFVTFDRESGFGEEVSVSVGLRYDSEELKESIDDILAGITEAERMEIMEAAISRQPLGE